MKTIYIVQALLLVIMSWHEAVAESGQEKIMEMAASAGESSVVQGLDGWLFLKEELEHLGSKAFYGQEVLKITKAAKPELGDPLPAIVDFNDQLKARGIELVFVPIPPKALIYSDKLPGGFTQEETVELERPYRELYAKLAEEGVQVLDLLPIFQEAHEDIQLYCKTDTHYSGAGLGIVADELNRQIRQNDWYAAAPKKEYKKEAREVAIRGDLAVMNGSDIKETVALRFIVDPLTAKAEVPDPVSPVLLLGDSHTLVFSVGGDLHTRGAGLFDQLNAALGFPVDLIGVRGSGSTASRIKLYQRARKNPDFIEKKKLVIWCLSARELTGLGGWRKIPVAKK